MTTTQLLEKATQRPWRAGSEAKVWAQGLLPDLHMRLAEFSAFIGYSTGRNETTGNNIHFTVYRSNQ